MVSQGALLRPWAAESNAFSVKTMSDANPTKHVYCFGAGQAEANGDLKHLVGGKGASLADMTRAGLNVPPGFTISAECCDHYYRNDRRWPGGLDEQVRAAL